MAAIALVTDLIFGTKIKSTADEIGVPVAIVRSVQAVEAAVSAGLHFAIIDLNADGVDPVEVIRRCKTAGPGQDEQLTAGPEHASSAPMVIAFGSHVEKALLRAAEQAGADLVLPRSRFTHELPDLLAQYGQASGHR